MTDLSEIANNPELRSKLEQQVEDDQKGGALVPRAASMTPYPAAADVKRWQPKALTPKHKQILSLKAQGMSHDEIGSLCKCSPQLVVMLAASELGHAYLNEIDRYMDAELSSMAGLRNRVIREQMQAGSGENQLKAAKLQMQATGKLKAPEDGKETAEDVIQRILNMQVNGDVNVTINRG